MKRPPNGANGWQTKSRPRGEKRTGFDARQERPPESLLFLRARIEFYHFKSNMLSKAAKFVYDRVAATPFRRNRSCNW
jgi:hypothetical protein